MSKITNIDVYDAGQAIRRLKDRVSDFASAYDTISKTASRLRGCWGDDETGRTFGQTYVEQEEGVLKASKDTVKDLTNFAKSLENVVKKFVELDAASGRYLEFRD